MLEGLPESFAADFLITHFFNPPRIMRLLEVVSGKTTRADVTATIVDFADRGLGKSVVRAKDTPGFIGNRIGNYWMVVAQNEAIHLGLDAEEADAVIGKPFAFRRLASSASGPRRHRSHAHHLAQPAKRHPCGDAVKDYDAEPPLIARMIAENRIGRKSGAGFVRLAPDRKSRDVTDLKTGEYRPQKAVSSESLDASGGDPRALMEHPAVGGRFASIVMEKTLAYARRLCPRSPTHLTPWMKPCGRATVGSGARSN